MKSYCLLKELHILAEKQYRALKENNLEDAINLQKERNRVMNIIQSFDIREVKNYFESEKYSSCAKSLILKIISIDEDNKDIIKRMRTAITTQNKRINLIRKEFINRLKIKDYTTFRINV